jgi:hypothetical protein
MEKYIIEFKGQRILGSIIIEIIDLNRKSPQPNLNWF